MCCWSAISATHHGRLLRYVWVGDLMVNGELVRLGLAKANSYFPIPYGTISTGLKASLCAGLGIWSITHPPPPPAAEHQPQGVFIAEVHKAGKPETVTLENGLGQVDLSGWTLVSVRGNQRYGIPGGQCSTPARIGLQRTGCGYSRTLFWTTDNVWNNSEFDPASLRRRGRARITLGGLRLCADVGCIAMPDLHTSGNRPLSYRVSVAAAG